MFALLKLLFHVTRNLFSRYWSQLAAITSSFSMSPSCAHSICWWCWEGQKPEHWGKVQAERSLFGRAFLVSEGDGSQWQWMFKAEFIVILGQHPIHRNLVSCQDTQSAWHSSHPKPDNHNQFIFKRNCPVFDGENVLSPCVLSVTTEDKHQDLDKRIACLHSFMGWWLTSLVNWVANNHATCLHLVTSDMGYWMMQSSGSFLVCVHRQCFPSFLSIMLKLERNTET